MCRRCTPSRKSWSRLEQLRKYIADHVQEVGKCLEWTAGKTSKRRAAIRIDGITWTVARVVLKLKNGHLTNDALHTCDNNLCVRYEHLYDGTQSQNMMDRHARNEEYNRRNTGEHNPNAKISDTVAREIVRLYHTGNYTQRSLAGRFNISQTTVSLYLSGKLRRGIT